MTIVAVPAIRDLGTVPNNNMDESTFNSASESFTSNMPPWAGDLAAVAGSAKTNAEHAHAKAGESAGSAQTAADRLIDVQAAANGAFASANYKGEWSSLTGGLSVPATVTHQGRLWYLKSSLANVTTQAPALGSVYWGEVGRNDFVILHAPSGATNAVDRGFYRMNTGASILRLPANPIHGAVIAAINVSGALTPVIQRNGKTILGDAEDFTMNVLGFQIVLQYDASVGDWLQVNGAAAYNSSQPFASTSPWAAAQTFSGGIAIGDQGTVLKTKSIAINLPPFSATAEQSTSAAHGLDRSKIRGMSVVVNGPSYSVGAEYGSNNTLRYSAYIDAASVNVYLAAGNGSGVAGQVVHFTISYVP